MDILSFRRAAGVHREDPMRPAFHPRLINGPFEDPGLFVPFHYERRALMFDLGSLGSLTSRELLSVSHVFVSHAHVDHFIGFDSLLRVFLGREKTLHLTGPPDFFERVEGKLAGYTWNLVDEYEHDLVLVVTEVREDVRVTRRYSCKRGFRPMGVDESAPPRGPILEEPRFSVFAALLDHRIPCLGFSLKERFHVNINKDALDTLHLPVGPWIDRFKAAIYEGKDPGMPFRVDWKEHGMEIRERIFPLGELKERIAAVTPGKKIAYITDVTAHRENLEKIHALADGADHLFIEGAFLWEDRDLAAEKHHLTAAQAGAVARRAGVRDFTLFHFSPRYLGREEELRREALECRGQPASGSVLLSEDA